MHIIYNPNKASSGRKKVKMMTYSTESNLMKCFYVFEVKPTKTLEAK